MAVSGRSNTTRRPPSTIVCTLATVAWNTIGFSWSFAISAPKRKARPLGAGPRLEYSVVRMIHPVSAGLAPRREVRPVATVRTADPSGVDRRPGILHHDRSVGQRNDLQPTRRAE